MTNFIDYQKGKSGNSWFDKKDTPLCTYYITTILFLPAKVIAAVFITFIQTSWGRHFFQLSGLNSMLIEEISLTFNEGLFLPYYTVSSIINAFEKSANFHFNVVHIKYTFILNNQMDRSPNQYDQAPKLLNFVQAQLN